MSFDINGANSMSRVSKSRPAKIHNEEIPGFAGGQDKTLDE